MSQIVISHSQFPALYYNSYDSDKHVHTMLLKLKSYYKTPTSNMFWALLIHHQGAQ